MQLDTVVDKIEGALPDKAAALFAQARGNSRLERSRLIRSAA